jgi:hypothetical protein
LVLADTGTDFKNIFAQKMDLKNWRIILAFKKTPIFADNQEKSLKWVTITLTPDPRSIPMTEE